MANDQYVTADMRKSMELVSMYEGVILGMLKASGIVCVEGDDNDVLRMLDLTCGIDYYNVHADGLVRGVASRWQTIYEGQPVWNTFTVRKTRESGAATEYEKRKRAIKRGGEYPYLTMQGYVDEGNGLLSIGIARTADIIECIDKGRYYEQHTRANQKGQASFYVVKWKSMTELGYELLVYRRDNQ